MRLLNSDVGIDSPQLPWLSAWILARSTVVRMAHPITPMETALERSGKFLRQRYQLTTNGDTNFPHGVPQNTFSREQVTFSTSFFPHAHSFFVKKEQGGQGDGSS